MPSKRAEFRAGEEGEKEDLKVGVETSQQAAVSGRVGGGQDSGEVGWGGTRPEGRTQLPVAGRDGSQDNKGTAFVNSPLFPPCTPTSSQATLIS